LLMIATGPSYSSRIVSLGIAPPEDPPPPARYSPRNTGARFSWKASTASA
jgi:hypothetical protein